MMDRPLTSEYTQWSTNQSLTVYQVDAGKCFIIFRPNISKYYQTYIGAQRVSDSIYFLHDKMSI